MTAATIGDATAAAPAAPITDDSTSTVFAWVGAVVINIAFGGLVAWGAATQWILGCLLAAAYTAVLFGGAAWLHDRRKGEHTVLSSLLFLLGVIGIGITGSFFPFNLWGRECGTDLAGDGAGRAFVTNATAFPDDIDAWFQDTRAPNRDAAGKATFAHLAAGRAGAATIFVGSDGLLAPDDDDGLLTPGGGASSALFAVMADGAPPAKLAAALAPLAAGGGLASNADHACIRSGGSGGGDAPCAVGCTGGANFTEIAVWEDGCLHMDYRFSAEDDRLYVIGWVGGFEGGNRVVASLDPREASLGLVEYSSPAASAVAGDAQAGERAGTSDGGDGDGDCTEATQRQSLAGLVCLALLPALAASAALHRKRAVPSISLGIYGATTGIALSLVALVSLDPDLVYDAARWWLPLSSLAWIVCLVLSFLTERIGASPLSWSLNFAGSVFFAGMLVLFRIFGDNYGAWYCWVAITLACFVPLLLVGIVAGRLLLLVFAAVGLMMDIYRVTAEVNNAVAEGFRIPVTFSILAVSGLGLAMLGYFVNKRQEALAASVEKWTDSYLSKWKPETAGRGAGDDGNNGEMKSPGPEGDCHGKEERGLCTGHTVSVGLPVS